MNAMLVKTCAIAGFFFVVALIYAGDDPRAMFFAVAGLLAGMAAAVPFMQFVQAEERHRAEREAAVAWMDVDPYGFSQRIADVMRDGMNELEGAKLIDAIAGASLLSASLEENVRIAKVHRYEEILRARL